MQKLGWNAQAFMVCLVSSFVVVSSHAQGQQQPAARCAGESCDQRPVYSAAFGADPLQDDETCPQAAYDAVRYLRHDIRNDPELWGGVSGCIKLAPLVEASCDDQLDRGRILQRLFEDDELWRLHCQNLGPDVDGHAPIDITGTYVTLDFDFVNSSSKERIASVIAHEVMHNLGFTHEQNPFNSTLYSLTVPEQVEACVQDGRYYDPPYSDYLDRSFCCGNDRRVCASVDPQCMQTETNAVDISGIPINAGGMTDTTNLPYYGRIFRQADGTTLTTAESRDALMCTAQLAVGGSAP